MKVEIALAANGGLLMQRIERILGIDASVRPLASGWRIATGLTVALALAAAGTERVFLDRKRSLVRRPVGYWSSTRLPGT